MTVCVHFLVKKAFRLGNGGVQTVYIYGYKYCIVWYVEGYGECSGVMEVIGIGTGEGLEDVIDELGREGEDGCCLWA